MRILKPLKIIGYHVFRVGRKSLFFHRESHSEGSSKEIQRIFSGIQPTGIMHLGNYLGAIKNWVALQNESNAEILYSIVDLHSITLPQEPFILKQSIRDMTVSLLACGVDPKRSIIFKQSEVPQHAEMAWILSCITPSGILNRMHQWKSKSTSNQEAACLGLYSYPVLMSADILLYRATHVPIGDDQLQHLELTRELARIFNNTYRNFFTPPKPILGKITRVMSLRDATKKMSKSDANGLSRIDLSDSPDIINTKIMKSVTDSINHISYNPEERPGVSNLIDLYGAFSGQTIDEICTRYQDKEPFKAVFKEDLIDLLVEHLSPIQQEIIRLQNEKSYVDDILRDGADKACELAQSTLNEVKLLVGFL